MTKEKTTRDQPRLDLVGCCFHTFKEDNAVQHQGVVRGDLGGQYYLVQYFEWLTGGPEELEIIHISRMCGNRAERWQFYEDNKHMNFWYEYRHHHKKQEDADTVRANEVA
jgi:hypothetical protein